MYFYVWLWRCDDFVCTFVSHNTECKEEKREYQIIFLVLSTLTLFCAAYGCIVHIIIVAFLLFGLMRWQTTLNHKWHTYVFDRIQKPNQFGICACTSQCMCRSTLLPNNTTPNQIGLQHHRNRVTRFVRKIDLTQKISSRYEFYVQNTHKALFIRRFFVFLFGL